MRQQQVIVDFKKRTFRTLRGDHSSSFSRWIDPPRGVFCKSFIPVGDDPFYLNRGPDVMVKAKCSRSMKSKVKGILDCNILPSRQSLKESMRRYLVRIAMSSHMRCCSKRTVGEIKVLLISWVKNTRKERKVKLKKQEVAG